MATDPLKISYCTACKGRLHQLRETLPANLAAEKDHPNVEFTVLDYGDEGEHGDLGAWIKTTFPDELASGRVRYARHEAKEWRMAHAKNMAHRLATGDVVCNVDADNFIAPNFSQYLNEQFAKEPHALVTTMAMSHEELLGRRVLRRLGRRHPNDADGQYGRLAMTRQNFEQLGGYDEKFSAWGHEDLDLAVRARDAGQPVVRIDPAQLGPRAIKHAREESLKYLSAKDRAISESYMGLGEHATRKARVGRFVQAFTRLNRTDNTYANAGQAGCGEVTINFAAAPTTIAPLHALHDAVPATPQTTEVIRVVPAGARSDWAASLTSRGHSQKGDKAR